MPKKKIVKRRSIRKDSGDAFLPDPASGVFIPSRADDAEAFAEEFIAGATSADFVLEDARNELSMDEVGGPFVEDDVPPQSAWLVAEDSEEEPTANTA
jgi:hypothetical protein